ncbi:MAG: cob(I)yrinic acid a,c-diamide adenosyltransferase [Chitinophagaceae bacterium]
MAIKIYTKTGDKGTTALIGGTKVPKSHIRIESYGTIDELNSWIGVVADSIEDSSTKTTLKEVQDRLFTIGSSLACDPDKETKLKIPDLLETDVAYLESEIDRMNAVLPEMKAFILPGGSPAVSFTHVARCVCRRAERTCVAMQMENMEVEPLVLKYLNRLSDYLFIVARFINHLQDGEEIQWKPRTPHPNPPKGRA